MAKTIIPPVISLLAFVGSIQAQGASIPADEPVPAIGLPPVHAQNASVQALVYGYPLTQYVEVAGPLVYHGANSFFHRRALSTAEDIEVVRPNEDTLYSSLVYDLSHGDVVINYPGMPQDLFHLMTYYDPFGNILASVGSGYTDAPGQYLIRQRPAGAVLGLDNSTAAANGSYAAYINSPTTYGIVLMRLVLNSTNIDTLHALQNATTSQNVTSTTATGAPYLLDVIQALQAQSSNNNTSTPPNASEATLGLLTAFSPFNPPFSVSEVLRVGVMLEIAGVANGSYQTPAGVDLAAAAAAAEQTIRDALLPSGKATNVTNDWSMVTPDQMSPDFGSNYAVRAIAARDAYLITKPPNTIYLTWTNVTAGEQIGLNGLAGSTFTLGSGEALLYDFVGGHPPLIDPGFWSMTMYDTEGFLVENPVGVYRLGDRDNLTYPGSTERVYPPSTARAASKPDSRPFQILVQPADVSPPVNWTGNWLPSPPLSEDKNFNVWLRFYGTAEDLVSGNYTFPTVTKIAAITNTSVAGDGSTDSSITQDADTSGASSIGAWWVNALGTSLLATLAITGMY
jgi:hypothetical protein